MKFCTRKISMVSHAQARMGCFASKIIAKNKVVCYFHGTLVHKNIIRIDYRGIIYVNEVMGLSPSELISYALQLEKTYRYSEKRHHNS